MSDITAQSNESSSVELNEVSVLDLLSLRGLTIPEYQRPYMWTKENVRELFSDIDSVFENKKKYGDDFKYRLGSVILFKKGESYDVVDGQQRIITLSLIILCLKELKKSKEEDKNDISIPKIPQSVLNKESVTNIKENYSFICERINNNDIYKEKLKDILTYNIEVMQFIVSGDESIAFQLFDSQNSRGKDLYPHDLLKAHHLRELNQEYHEKNYAESFVEEEISISNSYAERWDNLSSDEILSLSELFNDYLFRLKRWLNNESANLVFTKDYIDDFKGVPSNSSYRFAKREFKASPFYQIGVPCCAGSDFFEMVFYYHSILKGLINSFENNTISSQNENGCANEETTTVYSLVKKYKYYDTFSYTKNLFYATLLLYYDRFNQLDQKAIETIFAWSVYPRVDNQSLHFSAIDYHAREKDSLIKIISSSLNHLKVIEHLYKYKEKIKKIIIDGENVKILRKAIIDLFSEGDKKNGN